MVKYLFRAPLKMRFFSDLSVRSVLKSSFTPRKLRFSARCFLDLRKKSLFLAALFSKFGLFIFFILPCTQAFAHDPFAGTTSVFISEDYNLSVEMQFSTIVAQKWTKVAINLDNPPSEQNLKKAKAMLEEKVRSFYEVTSGNHKLELESSRINISIAQEMVFFDLQYGEVDPYRPLKIKSNYIENTHSEFKSSISVYNELREQIALEIHSKFKNTSEFSIRQGKNSLQVFSDFLVEGIHHIFIGFDHLLFLFALLIVCGSLRPAILVISCFTLAHSLTLALAALNVVSISPSIVELFIALTIVYVGIENLYTQHKPKMRWALTGVFGLVHGLGFANVLREIGLGQEGASIALPLLAFNLGVEIGQITLAILVLPILWWLKRKFESYKKRALPAMSTLIVLMGTYWAITRI